MPNHHCTDKACVFKFFNFGRLTPSQGQKTIFSKFEQWGMGLGMFWWSNGVKLKNLSLIYEMMMICEKIGTLSIGNNRTYQKLLKEILRTLLNNWFNFKFLRSINSILEIFAQHFNICQPSWIKSRIVFQIHTTLAEAFIFEYFYFITVVVKLKWHS